MSEEFSGFLTVSNASGKVIARIGVPITKGPRGLALAGQLVLNDADGNERLRLNAASAAVEIGGNGQAAELSVESAGGVKVVSFAGGPGDSVQVFDDSLAHRVVLAFNRNAYDEKRVGLFVGAHASQGGGQQPGTISIRDRKGKDSVVLSGDPMWDSLAIDDADKRLLAFNKRAYAGKKAGLFVGAHSDGGGKRPGVIAIRDEDGNDSLILDGEAGDIVLNNADCAEEFDVVDPTRVKSGDVLVIAASGLLRRSTDEYDTKVAGVVAGAGGVRPGIILGRQVGRRRPAIAVAGRVYCNVDGTYGDIGIGDLLTTSPTEGHAMRASGLARAFGAVLGKALAVHTGGRGSIPILVALQ